MMDKDVELTILADTTVRKFLQEKREELLNERSFINRAINGAEKDLEHYKAMRMKNEEDILSIERALKEVD